MTRTTFLRFTILQDSHNLFTDGRTFIKVTVDQNEKRGADTPALSSFLAESDPPLRQIVGRDL